MLLIDTLNRTLLPLAAYPFAIGDELVSVDGVPVEQLLQDFAKYAPQGNPVSTRRMAAQRITTRPQSRMPHASDLGEAATVLIRRQNGNLETYTIPWVKTGTPVRVGPVPMPRLFDEGLFAPSHPPKRTTWPSWNAPASPACCGPKTWESWDTGSQPGLRERTDSAGAEIHPQARRRDNRSDLLGHVSV